MIDPTVAIQKHPKRLGRRRMCDATSPYAFSYKMPAGFPGMVSRPDLSTIEPCLVDPTSAPLMPGMPVVVNPATNSVRALVAGDVGLTRIYGLVVRIYPQQQTLGGMQAAIGVSTVPGPTVSICRRGYVMVPLNGGTPAKDGLSYIWVAATSGVHIQGAFESAATGGSTIALPQTAGAFNGPPDSYGAVEFMFNLG